MPAAPLQRCRKRAQSLAPASEPTSGAPRREWPLGIRVCALRHARRRVLEKAPRPPDLARRAPARLRGWVHAEDPGPVPGDVHRRVPWDLVPARLHTLRRVQELLGGLPDHVGPLHCGGGKPSRQVAVLQAGLRLGPCRSRAVVESLTLVLERLETTSERSGVILRTSAICRHSR